MKEERKERKKDADVSWGVTANAAGADEISPVGASDLPADLNPRCGCSILHNIKNFKQSGDGKSGFRERVYKFFFLALRPCWKDKYLVQ